jgi:glycerol kinase
MILAIDQGTTGTTLLLVNQQGEIVDREYAEITQYYPRPGWVEQDPEEILQGVLQMAAHLVNRAPQPIQALGITNQRETVVLWDKQTGKPLHNAIVWQDRRTADICRQLKPKETIFRQKTGLLLDPYFSGTKLKWLLNSDPQIHQAAQHEKLLAGTIDTWLTWHLTGRSAHVTDQTNASRTLCCNIHTGQWDQQLLDYLELPPSLFPRIYPSGHLFGHCRIEGLPDNLPITGIAGDQQAALFGQGCIKPGLIKNTYGTGCFLMSFQGSDAAISPDPILTTLAATLSEEKAYAAEGSVFVTGAAVQWLRDKLGFIKTARESESLAQSIPHTDGVYVVPAFAGLGAPYWDAHARGAVVGLTAGAGKAQITRAVLESIAYQTADVLSIPSLAQEAQELRVDGGACRNDFLMQFQADILGIPVNRPQNIETTALGAAYLAGLQIGFWSDISDVLKLRRVDRIFEPKMSQDQRESLLSGWHIAVQRVLSKQS